MRFFILLISLTSAIILTPYPLQAKKAQKNKPSAVKATLDESGTTLDLDGTLSVNIRIVKNRFELYFLDEQRVPQPLKYPKARLVFEPTRARRKSQNKVIMTLSAAKEGDFPCLRANKVIRPPHNGVILVTLLGKGENKPLGTIQFRASSKNEEEAPKKNR